MQNLGIPPVDRSGQRVERDHTPAIYGALLVTTLIAVQWRHDVSTIGLGIALVGAVIVFWLTHVWSRLVNRRVRGPIPRQAVGHVAAEEAPMLSAAVIPAVLLGLLPSFGATTDQAVAVALIVSMGQLFLWGLVVGRAAHTSWLLAISVATVDLLLGLAIVGLKVIVLH